MISGDFRALRMMAASIRAHNQEKEENTMKFVIDRTSSLPLDTKLIDKYGAKLLNTHPGWNDYEIEITSLEQLIELLRDAGEDLILKDNGYVKGLPHLEIYDDYRE